MICASEARMESLNNGKAKAIKYCKKWIEYYIKEAMERGSTKTCLTPTSTIIDGRFYDCKDEIKSWLRYNGYYFKPTGYVGGVMQRTEDICW